MCGSVKLRYILKVISAAIWVIILPICYTYSWENPSDFVGTVKSWIRGNGQNKPSLYILAVTGYLIPNMFSALLFLFPFLRRFLEKSNFRIVTLMMWWSQVFILFFLMFYSILYSDTQCILCFYMNFIMIS